MTNEFEGMVAVITGGGSGIGEAIAKKLAAGGAYVMVFGRDRKKLEALASKNISFVEGDVRNINDLDRLYNEIQKKWGRIDLLFANAGVGKVCHVSEVNEAIFDEIVNTNYKGLYFTVQRSLPFLKEGAAVVLISSVAAHITWPMHSVYSSAKAAVSYLAKSFSSDLMERGIRVNALSPGFIDTPMNAKIPPENREKITSKYIPAKRMATSEEAADAALFLASPRSQYIIGADLIIDGGLSSIMQVE